MCLGVEEERCEAECVSIAERCTILCLFNTGCVGGNVALDTVAVCVCVCLSCTVHVSVC